MNKYSTLILGVLLHTVIAAIVEPDGLITGSQCKKCYAENKSVCLTGGASPANFDVSKGNCCTGTGHTLRETHCWNTREDFYCSSNIVTSHKNGGSKQITNPQMQQWTCPADPENCPNNAGAQVIVNEKDPVFKTYTWNKSVPNPEYQYNCKYRITIDKTSLPIIAGAGGGFLVVTIEQYGFMGSVSVMGQKNDKWVDFAGNSGAVDSRVYANATFGQKFFFPYDWDILINFEPTSNYPGQTFTSAFGLFKIKAQFTNTISDSDKLHIQPVYVASNQALLASPPVEQDCAADKTQDQCIQTCAQNVKQDKCSCKDYPTAEKCKATNVTCEQDNTQKRCLVDCNTDSTQDFCVFTCAEQPNQKKCKCQYNPRLPKCLCPKGGVRNWDGDCIFLDKPWPQVRPTKAAGQGPNIQRKTNITAGIIILFVLICFATLGIWFRQTIIAHCTMLGDKIKGHSTKSSTVEDTKKEAENDVSQQVNTDNSMIKTDNSQVKLNATNDDKLEMGLQIEESHNFGERDNIGQMQIDGKEELANDIYQK